MRAYGSGKRGGRGTVLERHHMDSRVENVERKSGSCSWEFECTGSELGAIKYSREDWLEMRNGIGKK